jgi:PIN domain nuclease of toxin-antitoxin system
MAEQVVLDASAVLAYLQDEAGSGQVQAVLTAGLGVMSAVNYAEVAGKLLEAAMPEAVTQKVLDNLGLQVEAYTVEQAWYTALLRTGTKALGLSLGDRACLALATVKNLPVLTADKSWDGLAFNIKVLQSR